MRIVFGLFFGLLATTIGTGYLVLQTTPSERTDSAAPPTRKVQNVVRGIGFVEPATEIRRLSFPVTGVIDVCLVDVGQVVERGDLLMSLRNLSQRAELSVAEQQAVLAAAEQTQLEAGVNPFRITAAERKVELLRSKWRHAQRHYNRIHRLSARGATTLEDDDHAQTEVDTLATEVRLAEAELDQLEHHVRPADRAVAEAQVALAQSRAEAARRRLDDMSLTAPFDGTVLEVLKREGEGVRGVERDAAIAFADTSKLRVRAEVDERYVHRLSVGQTAILSGRGLGERRFEGRVATVKQLMGNKTMFARDAAERKDLDVIQCWIDVPDDFRPPLGLQVDVEIHINLL